MNFVKEGFPPLSHWTQEDKRLALRVWNEYERIRRENHEQDREDG